MCLKWFWPDNILVGSKQAAKFGKIEITIAWQLQLHSIALHCSFETAAGPLAIAPDKSSHCIIV